MQKQAHEPSYGLPGNRNTRTRTQHSVDRGDMRVSAMQQVAGKLRS